VKSERKLYELSESLQTKIVYSINTQAETAGSERHCVNSSFSFVHFYDSRVIERTMRKNFGIPLSTRFDSFVLTNPRLTSKGLIFFQLGDCIAISARQNIYPKKRLEVLAAVIMQDVTPYTFVDRGQPFTHIF
jgi:hypothetical protein